MPAVQKKAAHRASGSTNAYINTADMTWQGLVQKVSK